MVEAGGAADIVELDQASMGRLSRMDAMQQQEMAKNRLARLAERKRKLEAALARLDAGSYGRCCACHEELEIERLEADPAAVFCAACAEERGLH